MGVLIGFLSKILRGCFFQNQDSEKHPLSILSHKADNCVKKIKEFNFFQTVTSFHFPFLK